MYRPYTRQNSILITIFFKIWNVVWFFSRNYLIFGLCYIIVCFFLCVNECLGMYLCEFHYKCVRIRTLNCITHVFFASLTVITIGLTRLLEIRRNRYLATITSDAQLNPYRQRVPLKNG